MIFCVILRVLVIFNFKFGEILLIFILSSSDTQRTKIVLSLIMFVYNVSKLGSICFTCVFIHHSLSTANHRSVGKFVLSWACSSASALVSPSFSETIKI